MRASRLFLLSTALSFIASQALAATQQEADSIKQAVEKYLGSKPGVVTTAVAGDAYELTLDFAAYMPAASGTEIKISPVILKLKPMGDGKWQVDQNQPLEYGVKIKDVTDVTVKVDQAQLSGIFDEAMLGFSDYTYAAPSLESKQDFTDLTTKERQKTVGTVRDIKGQSKSTLNASGGVDTKGGYSQGASETKSEIGFGGPNTYTFSYNTANGNTDYSGANFRQRELLALLTWFVARPSFELVKKDQEQLRPLLKAALPLFDSLDVKGSLGKLEVKTQFGNGTAQSVDIGASMNGLTKSGRLQERLALTGISFDDKILPPEFAWTKPLIPTDMAFDFELSGFDGASAAAFATDNFDLNLDPPMKAEAQSEFLAKALPTGALSLTMPPNLIKSPVYEFTYDANFLINVNGQLPSGKATLKMKGFEKTVEALTKAAQSDPSVNQAIGPLMAARGFAKQDGESLVWLVETNETGSILVNGVDVSKMGGP